MCLFEKAQMLRLSLKFTSLRLAHTRLLQVFRPKNIVYIEVIHKDFQELLHPFLKDLCHSLSESAQSILQAKWHYYPIKKPKFCYD